MALREITINVGADPPATDDVPFVNLDKSTKHRLRRATVLFSPQRSSFVSAGEVVTVVALFDRPLVEVLGDKGILRLLPPLLGAKHKDRHCTNNKDHRNVVVGICIKSLTPAARALRDRVEASRPFAPAASRTLKLTHRARLPNSLLLSPVSYCFNPRIRALADAAHAQDAAIVRVQSMQRRKRGATVYQELLREYDAFIHARAVLVAQRAGFAQLKQIVAHSRLTMRLTAAAIPHGIKTSLVTGLANFLAFAEGERACAHATALAIDHAQMTLPPILTLSSALAALRASAMQCTAQRASLGAGRERAVVQEPWLSARGQRVSPPGMMPTDTSPEAGATVSRELQFTPCNDPNDFDNLSVQSGSSSTASSSGTTSEPRRLPAPRQAEKTANDRDSRMIQQSAAGAGQRDLSAAEAQGASSAAAHSGQGDGETPPLPGATSVARFGAAVAGGIEGAAGVQAATITSLTGSIAAGVGIPGPDPFGTRGPPRSNLRVMREAATEMGFDIDPRWSIMTGMLKVAERLFRRDGGFGLPDAARFNFSCPESARLALRYSARMQRHR